ncbi:uncharacterized protein LOC124164239 [Ischnura elegans]|uniref:uncharacterized protein LOC124164239 n=1 Tax=Ischnura elegans TaxID=197161 RepID=UPI001ED8B942|nr:uncharacterized protein LOC124164239 [Ischnura elegans]XP_046397435.1 uncharacterized protein LOC124164239 [Ischnura elegans]
MPDSPRGAPSSAPSVASSGERQPSCAATRIQAIAKIGNPHLLRELRPANSRAFTQSGRHPRGYRSLLVGHRSQNPGPKRAAETAQCVLGGGSGTTISDKLLSILQSAIQAAGSETMRLQLSQLTPPNVVLRRSPRRRLRTTTCFIRRAHRSWRRLQQTTLLLETCSSGTIPENPRTVFLPGNSACDTDRDTSSSGSPSRADSQVPSDAGSLQ